MESGADLSIGSVHKTPNGLSQTSVLSRPSGDRLDPDRLSLVFELLQSTSASSLLLSSIDAARHEFQEDGEEPLGRALDLATDVRLRVDRLPGLQLMGTEVLDTPGAKFLDPTHITIDVLGLGLTGYQAGDWLREECGIHVGLADYRRVMALITYADTDDVANRVVDAFTALSEAHADADPISPLALASLPELRTETVMSPREASLGRTEMVPWREAPGRISRRWSVPTRPAFPSSPLASNCAPRSSTTCKKWPPLASWSKERPTRPWRTAESSVTDPRATRARELDRAPQEASSPALVAETVGQPALRQRHSNRSGAGSSRGPSNGTRTGCTGFAHSGHRGSVIRTGTPG